MCPGPRPVRANDPKLLKPICVLGCTSARCGILLGSQPCPSTNCQGMKGLGLFPHEALENPSPGILTLVLCPGRRMFTDLHMVSGTGEALEQGRKPSAWPGLSSLEEENRQIVQGGSVTNLASEHDSTSFQLRQDLLTTDLQILLAGSIHPEPGEVLLLLWGKPQLCVF